MGGGRAARISHKISSRSQAECYTSCSPLDSTPTHTTSAIQKPRPSQFTLPPSPKLPGIVTTEDGSQEQVDFCILALSHGLPSRFPILHQGIEPSPESYPPKFPSQNASHPSLSHRPLTHKRCVTQRTPSSLWLQARQFLAFPSSHLPSSSEINSLDSSKPNTTPKVPPPAPILAFLSLLVHVVIPAVRSASAHRGQVVRGIF